MPTVLTHPAVPLALALGVGSGVVSGRLLVAGVFASVLPDLDVVAFRLGIAYASDFGHRGFSHSILFAALAAFSGACLFRLLRSTFLRAFLFLFVAVVSHPILDAFTNGGLGVALLWPWSSVRYFAPVQVIEVAPIGISRFLSPKGVAVLCSELVWVWMPLMSLAVVAAIGRRLTLANQSR
jgi:inner membrane protein